MKRIQRSSFGSDFDGLYQAWAVASPSQSEELAGFGGKDSGEIHASCGYVVVSSKCL